jgi:energy-coupling factor transport system substrate-specific component
MPLTRKLALLGVLAALNCVVRLMGAGVAGVETAFALILIGGFALGSSFGFSLGVLSILASALISGGVGPWLPFQLSAAGVIGFGSGLLPKPKSMRLKLLILSTFAVFASYLYGILITIWTWPLFTGDNTSLSYEASLSIPENALRFVQFEVVSGGFLWDTGRAVTTVVLIALIGKTLVTTLERAATRANYSEA